MSWAEMTTYCQWARRFREIRTQPDHEDFMRACQHLLEQSHRVGATLEYYRRIIGQHWQREKGQRRGIKKRSPFDYSKLLRLDAGEISILIGLADRNREIRVLKRDWLKFIQALERKEFKDILDLHAITGLSQTTIRRYVDIIVKNLERWQE